jgi:hypothetical protein
MTERIPTPLAAKRLVYTGEELRRKREGTWDARTMVSVTSPEGAALLALQRASLEKVTVAQEIAVERLKNETPPHEPTSLPTPLTTPVENGTTKTELLPPAKAAASEAEGPETETTPLGAMDSKRSRSGGRQLKKQKLPAEISELGRKRSPERMRIFLDSLAEDAVLIHATNKACIHRKTPEYWLKCSVAGHDGYDVEWRGVTMKFHEHYISAMEEGGDIEEVAFRLATGYDEILTYKGRVSYKIDLVRWSLGHRGADAYLKDENGDPVPETVTKYDPKMLRWLLARHHNKYGKCPKTDVTHKTGVLVVGVPSKAEVTVAQEIAVERLKNETPPHEPTSLPTSLTTSVENGTTKADLRPPAKAATSEAEGPKTETAPFGAMGSKRSRSGGRQLKKQKLPAEISELGRKRSPERMRIFLDSLAEYPALIYATKKAGIHRRTPEYWLKGSAAGHDGYDVEWRGVTMKFHEHHISAMEEGVDQLKAFAFRVATGYDEILTYKGRVSYKIDPVLLSLGHRGPDAYLKDENGDPVPETVRKYDLKTARLYLELYHPKCGKDRKMDVTHKTGVLVIGVPSKTEKLEKEFGGEQQILDVELDVDDGSEGEK